MLRSLENSTRQIFQRPRAGLTVVEVLTSIVVAMIGVFGVMVMIPFSVKQSQAGLDRDAATRVGRNAMAQFQINGFEIVTQADNGDRFLNWSIGDDLTVPGAQVSPDSTAAIPVQIFCIDPLGIREAPINSSELFGNDPTALAPAARAALGYARTFPFNPVSPYTPLPNELRLPVANVIGPNGPIGLAGARRIFRTQDDLAFGESQADTADQDPQLNGPAQLFDAGVGGNLERQSRGRISWCGIAVPTKDNVAGTAETRVQRYRFFVLIFKNRETNESDASLGFFDPNTESQMATALVVRPGLPAGTPDIATPLSTFQIEAPVSGGAIAKDDWIMITNRKDPTANPAVEPGFEQQVSFARVVSYTDIATGGLLTVDGSDFVFKDGSAPALDYGDTHVIHMKNVVAVYETSFTLEQDSTWNFSL